MGAIATHSDRRSESRKPVDVFVNRYLNGQPYLCRATDISRTGIRVIPLLEPVGTPQFMGLQFQLPGCDEVITASGETVFGTSGGPVGIRFTRLAPAAAAVIERFLRQNLA